MWDLNVGNYSKTELYELFDVSITDDEQKRCEKLVDAFMKVTGDDSKSEAEKSRFHAFVLGAGDRLSISPSQLHSLLLKSGSSVHSSSAKDKAFSNKNMVEEVGSHFLISNPSEVKGFSDEGPGRERGEGVNPRGTINPIKVHTISKAVNIDSRFRENYYGTQSGTFTVNLPSRITRCTQMRIGNLSIPLSYYRFSRQQSNVTFVVTINGTNRVVVTLPDGNYASPFEASTAFEGIEQGINNALTAAGINPETQLCFRVDRVSGRSVFAVPSPGGTGVTHFTVHFGCDVNGDLIPGDNLQLRCGWNLGFRLGSYEGGPSTSGSGAAIVSEGICMPSGPRYMFLSVDEFQSNSVNDYFYSAFQSSLLPNSVLTRIDVGALSARGGFFQLGDAESFTTQVNTSREYFGPITIEKLKLSLYDEYGRVIDLNNMDWSITLSFDCLYD